METNTGSPGKWPLKRVCVCLCVHARAYVGVSACVWKCFNSKYVSKCQFVKSNYVNTSNALTLRMSSKQIRFHVPPKLFKADSWIPQIIRQWIPEWQSGNRECTGPKGGTANTWNWRLITSGRLQMLATRNYRNFVVGEVPWSSVPKTTMDCHSKLVYCTRWGITSQYRSSCISRDRQRSYFRVPVSRSAAAFWTCCSLSMTFSVPKTRQLQ